MYPAVSRSFAALNGRREQSWVQRHVAAWDCPLGHEIPLKHLIEGLAEYGWWHRVSSTTPVGDDGVLGPAFQAMAEGILRLLNGELGRFDGGTLDALVRDICSENGVELEH